MEKLDKDDIIIGICVVAIVLAIIGALFIMPHLTADEEIIKNESIYCPPDCSLENAIVEGDNQRDWVVQFHCENIYTGENCGRPNFNVSG